MPTEEKEKELTGGDKDSGDAGGTTDPLGERSFNQNRFVPLRANPENIAGDTAAKDEDYGQNALSPDEFSEPNELPEETENRDTGRENPNEEGKNPLAESYENAPEDSGAERNTDAAKDTLKAPEEGGKNPIFKILTISSGITWFTIFFIVVVLILSVFVPSAPASEAPSGTNSATVEKIIQVAEGELGTRESANNCNPYGPCAPWCAYFVSWVYEKAGTPFSNGSIGSAIGVENYFKARGIWISDKSSPPKPGYTINYGDGYTHVDLVVAVNGDTATTIGGNEGSAGIVKKDTFNWRTKSIHGYGGFRDLYE